jgi:pyrroline-5-carboxylate reductase
VPDLRSSSCAKYLISHYLLIAAIQARLPAGVAVVRAMPNTPALVDAAATAIASGEHAKAADLEEAKRIFDAIGIT